MTAIAGFLTQYAWAGPVIVVVLPLIGGVIGFSCAILAKGRVGPKEPNCLPPRADGPKGTVRKTPNSPSTGIRRDYSLYPSARQTLCGIQRDHSRGAREDAGGATHLCGRERETAWSDPRVQPTRSQAVHYGRQTATLVC